jgi:hypothetical protein
LFRRLSHAVETQLSTATLRCATTNASTLPRKLTPLVLANSVSAIERRDLFTTLTLSRAPNPTTLGGMHVTVAIRTKRYDVALHVAQLWVQSMRVTP